ncbi:hypothetical protein [Nostoc sp. NIES-3756]|nr:hypothetical protein [Nostoc sp. NIES-3756]
MTTQTHKVVVLCLAPVRYIGIETNPVTPTAKAFLYCSLFPIPYPLI